MITLLIICAITWAVTAEIRLSRYRLRGFRELEAAKDYQEQIEKLEQANAQSNSKAHAYQAEASSLRAEHESLKKSNCDLAAKLDNAKQEENALRSKLNEANKRCKRLETALDESRRIATKSAEVEQETRKNLETEISARKQAVDAYIRLETRLRSLGQDDNSGTTKIVASASRIASEDEEHTHELAIFSDECANYAVIDVETTGFSDDDEIIEVAVIKVDSRGEVIDRFETTICSNKDSSTYALKTHGLDTQALQRSPSFEEVSHAIANCLDGRIIVAHNLAFDLRFLDRAFKKVEGLIVDFGRGIDTLYGGKEGEKAKLEELCKQHNISHQSHSAMGDAEALLSLLKRGALRPAISGQESAAKAVALMRPGDCEVRPRSMLTTRTPAADAALPADSDLTLNPISITGFRKGPLITLGPGDKVCCSCSSKNSRYRDVLYAKHDALGLVSARSVSARHRCIVLEDFSSTTDKALQARQLKKPFVRADDFVAYEEGGLLQTWVPSDS